MEQGCCARRRGAGRHHFCAALSLVLKRGISNVQAAPCRACLPCLPPVVCAAASRRAWRGRSQAAAAAARRRRRKPRARSPLPRRRLPTRRLRRRSGRRRLPLAPLLRRPLHPRLSRRQRPWQRTLPARLSRLQPRRRPVRPSSSSLRRGSARPSRQPSLPRRRHRRRLPSLRQPGPTAWGRPPARHQASALSRFCGVVWRGCGARLPALQPKLAKQCAACWPLASLPLHFCPSPVTLLHPSFRACRARAASPAAGGSCRGRSPAAGQRAVRGGWRGCPRGSHGRPGRRH